MLENFEFYILSTTSVTGGPHLLHQLVHKLRNNKINAYITYTDGSTRITESYKHYNIEVRNIVDKPNSIIIIPESHTYFFYKYKKSKKIIWWLSVDHYFGFSEVNKFRRTFSYLRHYFNILTRNKIFLPLHKNIFHLFQSEYARLFLQSNGINSNKLSDYLGSSFFSEINLQVKSKYTICYNPKKGNDWIKKIIDYFPDKYIFTPLIGMTEIEVSDTLKKSMIYFDFGNHPGKDRIPREAATSGCVVITNLRGSAQNNVDIPIDHIYKFKNMDLNKLLILCEDVMNNFIFHYNKFHSYREVIKQEEFNFNKDLQLFLSKIINS